MKQLIFSAVFAVLATVAVAQTDEAVRLRLAQGFEQAGDWERAVAVYESLYRDAPMNQVYYDGLKRGYIQLKEYQKAADIIRFRLNIHKEDPVLLSSLGGVYWHMGKEAEADSIWKTLLSKQPANSSLYRLVASQFMEFRLYDRAIQTFLAARKATGNEMLFVEELAGIYGAFQQYGNAAAEYVRMLRAQPQQLSYIQSRLSSFLNRPDALKPIQEVVQREVALQKDFVPLRQMSAWLHMEGKEYAVALEEYRVIDRMTNASGRELFGFAQRAMQEKAYNVAAIAWTEALAKPLAPAMVPVARFNYARSVEELGDGDALGQPSGRHPVSEAHPASDRAIALYEAVAADFPRSEFGARALFRIGVIRKERYFDLDGALRVFGAARDMLPGHSVAVEATMEIGRLLTMKNDLIGARREYEKLVGFHRAEIRDQAKFRLAELNYYEGAFDSAGSILSSLVENLQTDLANDAMELLYFIEENRTVSPDALRRFARADLLVTQHKHSEAVEEFEFLVSSFPHAFLVDDAYLRMAELRLSLGQPRAGLANLDTIIQSMPQSILRDRALLRKGEIYERVLQDTVNALSAYEQLLAQFPHSVHVEEARRRIRRIRGDVL